MGPFERFFAMIKANERLHIAYCVSGIVGCLLLYGVLQERIIAEDYDGERFKATLFIVMCNRLVTCAVAVLMLVSTSSNVVATFCQYEALKYVSFPVQTLGKCAKMIPVMIWGSLVNQKVYKAKDYIMALALTGGCVLFAMTGMLSSGRRTLGLPANRKVSSKASQNVLDSSLFGCLLMVGYLGFDGFTSTWQDKMFKGYQMSIYNQILYVQLCSACVSFVSLVVFGQLVPALEFLARHPECLWNILLLSLAATLGQLFIAHTIKTFGALLFATVMTTRQFLSILLSCFLFLHPLSPGQWLATGVVFGTLYYKNLSAQKKAPDSGPGKGSVAGKDTVVDLGAKGALEHDKSALERLIAAEK